MNNNCTAIGRLTKDIELRYTSNNKAVCDLSMAINNGKTLNGEDDTTFLNITVFGKNAENCAEFCKKGDLVGASYMVKNHNWEDKNGNKRYDYNFIANRITFLSTKKDGQAVSPIENKSNSQADVTNDDPFDAFQDFGEKLVIDDNFLE